MNGNRTKAGRTVVFVLVMVVIFDQLTKWAFRQWLGPDAEHGRWELAGRFLAFEYVENRGAAFGLFQGQTWFLTLLAVVIGGLFLVFMRDLLTDHLLPQIAIGLVLGGAIGNLIDRVRLGYVIDFIAVGTWPKFNLADSAITLGILAIAWTFWNEPQSITEQDERIGNEH